MASLIVHIYGTLGCLLKKAETPWNKLVGRIVHGGSDFVTEIQGRLSEAKEIGEIPRTQGFPGRPQLAGITLLFYVYRIPGKHLFNVIGCDIIHSAAHDVILSVFLDQNHI